MQPFPIPVHFVGAGSQTPFEEDALEYMPMPEGMHTYRPPRLPEAVDAATMTAAADLLERLLALMRGATFGVAPLPQVDLLGLDAALLALVNDSLGEGEVSARVDGPSPLHIQETLFAGVWRVQQFDAAGTLLADRIEASPMPQEVIDAVAADYGRITPPPPAGLMNAPAVLAELEAAAARYRPGQPAHIINLTLLPMSQADLDYLAASLGRGHAVILSRGYGNCRITSTSMARTWWVQYFNGSDALILNTLEVTELPDVAPAAPEDFADSIERLAEWIAQMREG